MAPHQPIPPKTFASSHPFSLLDQSHAPDLPAIKNDALYVSVFTHKAADSASAARLHLGLAATTMERSGSYNKLAHVGDSLLASAITLIIHAIFPDMSAGAATKLRARLQDQSALAYLSDLYNLGSRLVAPKNQVHPILSNDRNRAELFEAYMAAIFYDNQSADTVGKSTSTLTSGLEVEVKEGEVCITSPQRLALLQNASGWQAVLAFATRLFESLARSLHDDSGIDEEEVDRLAISGCANLHTLLSMRHYPNPEYQVFPYIPANARGEEGKEHLVTCRVNFRGEIFTADATRPSIKRAKNVAAWLVLQEMRQESGRNKRKAVS